MTSINRFVIWLCSRFDREQLEQIVQQLQEILANRNPAIKPKDDFKKNTQTIENSPSIPRRR